jgi:hypothetical protein
MTSGPSVLYVAGRARSGSTLLGNLLGQVDGLFHAGELRRFWGYVAGLAEEPEIRCGCGAPVTKCELWSTVADKIFSAPDGPASPELVVHWQQTNRLSRRWKLIGRPDPVKTREATHAYAGAMRRVYPAIAEVTGARAVIDTSKHPTTGLLLLSMDLPASLVQLVRDPRAVMHSWTRRVAWPGENDQAMRQYRPLASAMRWDAHNLLAEYVRHRYGPLRSVLVRYEDLVESPEATLRSLLSLMGMGSESALPVRGKTAQLEPGHALGGNPSKFRTGSVELREDNEWREAMGLRHRLLGTTLTFPLLRRYGYSTRSQHRMPPRAPRSRAPEP